MQNIVYLIHDAEKIMDCFKAHIEGDYPKLFLAEDLKAVQQEFGKHLREKQYRRTAKWWLVKINKFLQSRGFN